MNIYKENKQKIGFVVFYLLIIAFVIFSNLYAQNNFRVLQKCIGQKECPYTAGIIAFKVANQLEQDIILFDAKKSKIIPTYWHLSIMPIVKIKNGYKKTLTTILTTNGKYALPVVTNLKNKNNFKNLFLKEENGMYIGEPNLKNLVHLYVNKKNIHYVVFIDRLWDKTFFKIISAIITKKKKNFNLYLAPVFVGGKREKFQGKIFWSLIDNNFYTMNVAMFLSSLPHEAKYTESSFYAAVEKFIMSKNKNKLLKVKKALNFFNDAKLLEKNQKILKALRYDNPFINSFIIDNRVYFYPIFISDKNFQGEDNYYKYIIKYFFRLLQIEEKREKNKKIIFKNHIPFPKKIIENIKNKKCEGKNE